MIDAHERAAVESVLGADAPAGDIGRRDRHLLLATLHAVNDRVGWITPAAIDHIAQRLGLGAAEVYGVTSFYGLFSTTERPATRRHVCIDLACRASGSGDRVHGDTEYPSPCLGVCERGSGVFVEVSGAQNRRSVEPEPAPSEAVPQAPDPSLVLLGRAGRIDPWSYDDYVATGGFDALDEARRLGAAGIIERIGNAGLTGRGGAAFPTAVKWSAVLEQSGRPHRLVCNADESEPGTFKDRAVIENDPFAVVEAIAIASVAIGAESAHVYLRGEYPRAEATLGHAVTVCRDRGLIGAGGVPDITIVRGAGAYICGEETAIFNSIEGRRGEPRNKPPFPFEAGLFGDPTAVNNVETLINVPHIITGALPDADRRLFCVSGAVARPGVYEVRLGLTLGEMIDLAGGMRNGSDLQAVLLGGAAGGFAGPDDLGLRLTPADVASAGLTLGSGVVMVHDQHVDLVDQLRRIAEFFRDESCGQCVPCRVGTVRQHEAVERLARTLGDPSSAPGEVALLRDIGAAMRDASICGLGQTANNAIETAIVKLGVWS